MASTVDSYQLRDGLKVTAPAAVAGIAAGQMSVAYDWPGNGPTHAPVTGTVADHPRRQRRRLRSRSLPRTPRG